MGVQGGGEQGVPLAAQGGGLCPGLCDGELQAAHLRLQLRDPPVLCVVMWDRCKNLACTSALPSPAPKTPRIRMTGHRWLPHIHASTRTDLLLQLRLQAVHVRALPLPVQLRRHAVPDEAPLLLELLGSHALYIVVVDGSRG